MDGKLCTHAFGAAQLGLCEWIYTGKYVNVMKRKRSQLESLIAFKSNASSEYEICANT